ncbi:Transcriptional regulator containing PAS, AAA-type ATPase, and DNA-binding Fis domains [Desulfotomaculum arcticum]|uniref:Transcriptional regulator containing PAS, AAA-type ATPase, and DNA-binding Fis domains n=1 Tax=Desulfotruncus arcticus DSM 17038 TaxID=1121424 RepID=A0A1I2P583_9FIRM|nr:sigma 54-interacting transcriptional regulator [Desulfotruncus arcticus]SFG11204.1 Transcriptional regulator containing PAS, AAA-type ATPase, and DNA-binding Fis domains [Desulfotomaculum arcticum] [Desulfotruncus arcticus DSM 17038]
MVELSTPIKLHNVFDSTSNAVLAVNRSGIIIYCNRQVEKFLDFPSGEIIGKHVKDFFPTTGLLEVMENGRPQIDTRLALKNGTYLSNRNPIVINGKIVGAVAVFQDVTKIQNIIDELTTNNEKNTELKEMLTNILELSSDGIIAVNRDYIITMANQAFASFFNKKVDDIIGQHVKKVYNPIFPQAMETGQSEYGYVTTLNGHEIIANRVPIRKNGKIVGALGTVVFKNISDLYALSEKINNLRSQLDFYKGELKRAQRSKFTFDQIIGKNPAFAALKKTARRVAQNQSTILIRGESGTGKELFAHAIYTESERKNGPFVKVNCAAIPENLLESELFGYREGAFTGAQKGGHAGKFELAHKGVIFLDEIGDMPLLMQAKILRVLQEKEIERLGDTKPKRVNVRVIAATNRNLEEMVAQGEFRRDLYYRINVVSLNIPPLRDRIEDLELLLQHFIERFNKQFGVRVTGIDQEALAVLRNHRWPGNIRELENVVERAFNILEGKTVNKEHLPLYLFSAQKYRGLKNRGSLHQLVEEIEREAISDALKTCSGNKNQTAALLGISRAGLYKKLKRYKFDI